MYKKWLYETCMYNLFNSFTSYQNNVAPLLVAGQEGHHDVVQTLLKAGADVNMTTFYVSDVAKCI